MQTYRYLALIPARGGSKGVPNKNIIDINGKPLIEYSITPALSLFQKGRIGHVLVSTDSNTIAGIASELGADVPFLRPDELSTDTAKSIDVILHAIDFLERQHKTFDAVVLLQPTCPLRTEEDILKAMELFDRHENPSLISAYRDEYITDLVMYRKNEDFADPFTSIHNHGTRRQDHPKSYIRNGAIYITSVDYLKAEKKVISDRPLMLEMPKSRSINIDSMEDVEYLRWLVSK